LAVASNAQAAPLGTSVAYRAPARCPDGAVFIERVRARTTRGDLTPTCESAGCFAVNVTSDDAASSARVEFLDANDQAVVRTVTGETCDEVVSAAALITALAIEANLGPERDPNAEAPPPADAPAPAPSIREKPAPANRMDTDPGSSLTWGLGAAGGLDSWAAPGSAYAAAAFGEVGWRAPLRLVRLAFRGAAASTTINGRGATFTLLGARLSACPASLALSSKLELLPCAGIDVGRLAGRGEASAALPDPKQAAIFWSAAEALLMVRWQVGSLVALELGGELGFPLVRHSFIFEGPSQAIYDVPAVGAGVSAGAAVRFR
jgi:hypothetical protein